ncbi:MAG: xanthine dehydrogenase YagS FAD-binding subunit [Pseudonocardiales bacterium]|nr:xanthine dehydrogenase YagS FAD-binding subunit [Pseudonocardiales bacterium]
MIPFRYSRAGSVREACVASSEPTTAVLAGGTELLNWMRLGVNAPAHLVDIKAVAGLSDIRVRDDVVHIGALNTLNEVAAHPEVRARFPVLTEAITLSASAQLRNLATIGGNPLQSTRCPYYRHEGPTPCNKRRPGSGCAARHGITDNQAIFGWTDDCLAVQPSDPATALVALDAEFHTEAPDGGRRIPARELHMLPAEDPNRHHILRPGEIITTIQIPGSAARSGYLKVRERASYEFATVAVAAALELADGVISRARIALGSVALRPWRLDVTEQLLVGLRPESAQVEAAVDAGFADARGLPGNEYKIILARHATLRAVREVANR